MIPKNTTPGIPVEVQLRDDARHGGYELVATTGAIDCPYRVIVRGNDQYLNGIHPACVRTVE